MNRLDEKFKNLRKNRQRAIIIFITAGDPDTRTSERLMNSLSEAGADVIELGVPFSDPVADGVTIQKASQRALLNGMNLGRILSIVKRFRRHNFTPTVLFSYYNPILAYGLKKLVRDAKACGIDGIIVPDLSMEEAGDLSMLCKEMELCMPLLVAPTSLPSRIKSIARASTGFVYYVSRTGVTGEKRDMPDDIERGVTLIKKWTHEPVAVGFGISMAHQVRAVLKTGADAVVIGSAIVRRIEENVGNRKKIIEECTKFVKQIEKISHVYG